MGKIGESFEKLVSIMGRLRAPGGCDWDRAQTHESLKPYLIEEAYELLDAIDREDDEEIKEELGDVLLQVVFHAQIASERGAFNIGDVVDTLSEKLVRRHPHVFKGEGKYSYERWESIKAEEKKEEKKSAIGKINPALPALSMARRVQENASAVGFDWDNVNDVLEKVKEELDEFKENPSEDEFGDILFSLVNLSRFLGFDPERALRKATEKFVERFHRMEELIRKEGKELRELSLEEMNRYWEEVKTRGGS